MLRPKDSEDVSNHSDKRKIISIAFIALLIAIIISLFLFINPVSSLGKFIDVTILCDETGLPIEGVSVTVTAEDGSAQIKTTDAQGYARFGSGYPVGSYVVTFVWDGETVSRTVDVTCRKEVWHVTIAVANPSITKTFVYKTIGGPVVDLGVCLYGSDGTYIEQYTDSSGTVVFGGSIIQLGVEYYLSYNWHLGQNHVTYFEPDASAGEPGIVFTVDSDPMHLELLNELDPKSEEMEIILG